MNATGFRPIGGVILVIGVTFGVSGAVLLFTALVEMLITIPYESPLATIGIFVGLLGTLFVSAGWTFAARHP